jgi:predicted DNA binding CopG/RHH family protein
LTKIEKGVSVYTMAKGRNTTVVSVRLPDSVYTIIKRRAEKRGMAVGDWIKKVIVDHQHIRAKS